MKTNKKAHTFLVQEKYVVKHVDCEKLEKHECSE